MKHHIICIICLMIPAMILSSCADTLQISSRTDFSSFADSYANEADASAEAEERILLEMPLLCQHPELPTGCEAAAATMILQYYGFSVSKEELASTLLHSSDFYHRDGKYYGPNPNEVFAGDPFSAYAYGCFAPVIANAVNHSSWNVSARVLSEMGLQELCNQYLKNKIPVLIWATTGMKEVRHGNSWYLSDGTLFTWPAGEHCYVLLGFDDDFYYFADPQTGNVVGYQKLLAEKRFRELGSQAVLILKKIKTSRSARGEPGTLRL